MREERRKIRNNAYWNRVGHTGEEWARPLSDKLYRTRVTQPMAFAPPESSFSYFSLTCIQVCKVSSAFSAYGAPSFGKNHYCLVVAGVPHFRPSVTVTAGRATRLLTVRAWGGGRLSLGFPH